MNAADVSPPTVGGPRREGWPALGVGTWRFGEEAHRGAAEAAVLERAFEIGYRLVDTAEMYGEGGAERVVGTALGRALRRPGVRREDFRIVSKAYPHHASAAGLRRACEASLKRLKLDTIDLYLLHWRGQTPLTDTLAGFAELQRRGWIRHWGVSNFDLADLHELVALSGGTACAVNQVYYSLSERGVEFELLPWQRERAMPLMAYCPVDGGALARHRGLARLAASLDLSAAQLALAWLLNQDEVIAIPKAGREQHLVENWACRTVRLGAATRRELDEIFPPPRRRTPLAMR